MHRQGSSWAEIGELWASARGSSPLTRYTHALVDYQEIDRAKLLARVRTVQTSVQTSEGETLAFAGRF
jgi:hypothetical protein